MTSSFLRFTTAAAFAALATFASARVGADEPPAPSPAMPEKTPEKLADKPAEKPVAEDGIAFDRALSFDQGVAKGKADGKSVFIDFWKDH